MTDFTHSLAVVIGIDAYEHGVPPLTTAVNDATRLAELLQAAHGYETHRLTGEAAGRPVTRERLRALFTEELPARLGNDDRLLVYFAGHGVALDGDDGPRGYLVPQDARPGDSASMLAMTDLHAWLTALPCRHMLAILDCCFAGAFRWSATRDLGALPDVIHKERYDRYLLSPAWQVLTSTAYDQKALDVLGGSVLGRRETQGRHSPFAQALINALEKGAADLIPKGHGDGVITATELYLYLREQVEVEAEAQAGHEQTPGLWPLNKHRKGEFIFLTPGHPLNLPPAPDLTAEANPYRGLKSFDRQHSPLFFGREDEINELVQRVDQQPFLAVLGASGTGKSSLVKAGVLPRLAGVRSQETGIRRQGSGDRDQEGTTPYRVLPPMRPTDQPVRALETLLRAELGEVAAGLTDGNSALAQIVTRWAAAHSGQRLVLTVDQFEELATLCRDDDERERFLRLLAAAVHEQPAAFRLIITLRTDFEPQFATPDSAATSSSTSASALASAWSAARYVAPPMDIEDLRQVIEGPAAVRVLYFDPPELVDDLIKEVIQTPGALPLLSFTLSELYVKYVQSGQDNRSLTGADYQALGRVVGSLRNRATEEYDHLPDDAHRVTMQRVMLRMVSVEGGGELARRRVALNELEYPTAEENARVQTVLDRLVDARLLVRGSSENPDGTKGEAYVEPAHDALVLAWDKLLRWKKEAEEYLPLQRRLAQAATEWSRAQAEARSGLLWDDDPRLPQVEETLWPTGGKQKGLPGRIRWARQVLAPKTDAPPDTKWLNGAEVSFVRASVSRRASALRRIIGITAAVMIVLAGLAVFASYQAKQATTQRDSAQREARRARAGEFAAGAQAELPGQVGDPSLALLLAKQAVQTTLTQHEDTSAQVRATLRDAILMAPPWRLTLPVHRHAGPVNYAEFSPDGRNIVSASDDQTARVWDATTGEQEVMLVGHVGAVHTARFSPDGATIVTAGEDGVIRIWDVTSEMQRLSLIGHVGSVRSAGYAPDGKTILSAGDDGTARVWDAETGRQVKQLDGHAGGVRSASYSPDGRWIVTAGHDKTVRIWEAASGRQIRQLSGHEGPVNTAIFSPDSLQLLTASNDGTTRLWDRETGKQIQRLSTHTGSVTSAAFDPQGVIIATAGSDFSVHTWDARTGREISQYDRHTGVVNSVIFSSDGRQLLTASDDQTLRRWAVGGRDLLEIAGHAGWLRSAAFDLAGARIVTAGDDATIRLWDVGTGRQLLRLNGHTGKVNSALFSPAGERVVSASDDGTARLWDAQTGEELRVFTVTLSMNSAAFSPDGTFVVAASNDGTTRVWDVETGDQWLELREDGIAVRDAAFNHSGTRIATASVGRAAHIWNAESGEELHLLEGHAGAVDSVDFSPDDTRIVTASDDQTARVWDVETGKELLRLVGHAGSVYTAKYSPDGRYIVTAGEDTTVRIWDGETGRQLVQFTGHGRPVQSAIYSHDGKLIVTASRDLTARIWNADAVQEPRRLEHGDQINFAVYSQDGRQIITAGNDGRAKVWNALTGELLRELSGHQALVHSVAFDASGSRAVTASYDATARIWNVATGRDLLPTPLRHEDIVETATFSPDGLHILTASDDETARVWDAQTGKEEMRLSGHIMAVNSALYRGDGVRIVTAGDDRTARVWNSQTGEELMRLSHSDAVFFAAYSHDGTRIVTAGRDGIARLWDAETGLELLQLKGHSGPIFTATYSPDDQFVLTAGDDKTARLWRTATGVELRRLALHNGPVYSAMYRPDGDQIVTAGRDRAALIWPAASIENHPIEKLLEEADRLIQRDPPLLTPQELRQFGEDITLLKSSRN